MVSYYNPLTIYRQQQQQVGTQPHQLSQQAQQHQAHQQQQAVVAAAAVVAGTVDGSQQLWYSYPHHTQGAHHSQPSGTQQYLEHSNVLAGWPPHPHAHPYSHNFQYQHHQVTYQHHQQQHLPQSSVGITEWSGDEGNTSGVGAGEPSPPITVSGSEVSSPRTPSSPPVHTARNSNRSIGSSGPTTPSRPPQIRSPYEWMKKPSYSSQPIAGKTRTKDKYRVVYTDHQRLELEKEFHYSRYITIRRKAELASNLALSERQVKIWFQNRRAKERKQVKKREELEQKDVKPLDGIPANPMAGFSGINGMLNSLIHNNGSPPLNLGPPHGLNLSHPAHSLHPHSQQHGPPHTVIGL